MRRNPFKKLLPKNPIRQAADDFLESVQEARRIEAAGNAPELPTYLAEGMYAGVAIRDAPTWVLQDMADQGPLEYALGEAVCSELLRRRLGLETVTVEDALATVQSDLDRFTEAARRKNDHARRPNN